MVITRTAPVSEREASRDSSRAPGMLVVFTTPRKSQTNFLQLKQLQRKTELTIQKTPISTGTGSWWSVLLAESSSFEFVSLYIEEI